MDKQTFENDINTIDAELEAAKSAALDSELAAIQANAKVKELSKNRSALMSWGVARGFVPKIDILPSVIGLLGKEPLTTSWIADALDADTRAVAGALRRGVNNGQIVASADGYTLAMPTETVAPPTVLSEDDLDVPVTDVTDVAA